MISISWSDRAVVGFVAGVVAGLVLSTAVALYITKAPVPFINKVQRPTENVNPAADGTLPDPNRPLYSNQTAAQQAAAASAATTPDKPATQTSQATSAASAADSGGPRLMLQAGAYKSLQDADAMRARLALLGLDARVTQFNQDGATVLYRVRIGPFGGLDDLSGIRRTLSENGIEAQIVKTQ
jgi:cell division protein FtsN